MKDGSDGKNKDDKDHLDDSEQELIKPTPAAELISKAAPNRAAFAFATSDRADQAFCGTMVITTRRLSCLPAAVLLSATGWVSPKPRVVMRAAATP